MSLLATPKQHLHKHAAQAAREDVIPWCQPACKTHPPAVCLVDDRGRGSPNGRWGRWRAALTSHSQVQAVRAGQGAKHAFCSARQPACGSSKGSSPARCRLADWPRGREGRGRRRGRRAGSGPSAANGHALGSVAQGAGQVASNSQGCDDLACWARHGLRAGARQACAGREAARTGQPACAWHPAVGACTEQWRPRWQATSHSP